MQWHVAKTGLLDVTPLRRYDETQVTDETGCVTFDSMTWTSGGNGPVIVVFGADANATAGWTYVAALGDIACVTVHPDVECMHAWQELGRR